MKVWTWHADVKKTCDILFHRAWFIGTAEVGQRYNKRMFLLTLKFSFPEYKWLLGVKAACFIDVALEYTEFPISCSFTILIKFP